MNKHCRDCGCTFFASESWKTVCIDCFKDRKRKEAIAADTHAAYLDGYREGRRDGWNKAQEYKQAPALSLDLKLWRKLAQLCHPDKHAGSASANEALLWLNSVRPDQ